MEAMIRRLSRLLSLLLCIAVVGGAATAREFTRGDVSVIDPWSRELPPVAPNGAVWFRVENRAGEADRIVAVDSPVAERAELHVHETHGGMMTMRRVHAVEAPARGAVVLEPGGLHVMLFGLKRPLVGGERFPLTLVFESAGPVEVSVEVRGGDGATGAGLSRHEH